MSPLCSMLICLLLVTYVYCDENVSLCTGAHTMIVFFKVGRGWGMLSGRKNGTWIHKKS